MFISKDLLRLRIVASVSKSAHGDAKAAATAGKKPGQKCQRAYSKEGITWLLLGGSRLPKVDSDAVSNASTQRWRKSSRESGGENRNKNLLIATWSAQIPAQIPAWRRRKVSEMLFRIQNGGCLLASRQGSHGHVNRSVEPNCLWPVDCQHCVFIQFSIQLNSVFFI